MARTGPLADWQVLIGDIDIVAVPDRRMALSPVIELSPVEAQRARRAGRHTGTGERASPIMPRPALICCSCR